ERGADGRLVMKDGTGIVFVLIPAGRFWMGAQAASPSGRNVDPQADANESPVHEVSLDAYFLSKYEMTQDQWLRLAGKNPSLYSPGDGINGKLVTLLHPVENVSWIDCTIVLSRLALELPTEAQWEYGARAGTSTPWWTGSEKTSLRGAGNLADAYSKRH